MLAFPRGKFGPAPFQRAPVIRDRLFTQLEGGASLVLLVAPAGSGKTALLASWRVAGSIATPDLRDKLFIWYTLDSADQEPVRLVDGLAAAVEHVLPGAGLPSRQVLASGGAAFSALSTLLAALEDAPAVVLILDDCHHLEGVRGAEAILEHLVRLRPPMLRLVLASRSIPLIPALSSAATGDLRVLGRDDLRFRPDEAAALLASHGLSERSAPSLAHTVHGWAMGLLLLGHAQAGGITFLQQPSEALAAYLMAQIVDRLPEPLRSFVLESALLGPFTAAEADRILERRDSRIQIDAVLRQSLFMDMHPGEHISYQEMFADTLSARLRHESPERFRAIHTRAAELRGDDPLRALAHSDALEDPVHLAETLERCLPALRQQGQWETIARYGDLLPQASQSLLLLRMLSYAYYARGEDSRAMAAADRAHVLASTAGESLAMYSALVLHANPLVRQDRCAEALALCEPALRETQQLGLIAAEGWLAEICAQAMLRDGRIDEGQALYAQVLKLHRTAANRGDTSAALAVGRACQDLASLLLEIGEDREAQRCLDEAWRLAGDRDDRGLLLLCQATRSELLLLRGQIGLASSLAHEVKTAARTQGHLVAWRTALLVVASCRSQRGRLEDALAALDEYESIASAGPPSLLGTALCLRARIHLQAGNRTAAHAALDRAAALPVSTRATALVQVEQAALAVAEGRDHEAADMAEQAGAILESRALKPSLARAWILRAAALARLGKDAQAVSCLSEAGALAAETGWQPWLRASAEPVSGALRSLASHWRMQGNGRELLDQLLAAGTGYQLRLVPSASPGTPELLDASTWDATVPLRFSPFGECVIVQGTMRLPLARLRGDKVRELLAFAVWQARPLSRDEILDALWEGETDNKTLAALRTTSYQLRRFLGPDLWVRTGSTFRLGQPIEDEYRELLAMAAGLNDPHGSPEEIATLAKRCLAHYTGPYLPWCYSAWTDAPRALTQTAVLTAFAALVDAQRRLGQPVAAVQTAERGLVIEPGHQKLRQQQIDLLIELGRQGEALAAYHDYLRVLKDEGMGAPPAALRSAIAAIRQPVAR